MPHRALEIRGFTLQQVPKDDYASRLIDWMAEHDFNRLEVRLCGGLLSWPSATYPDLSDEKAGNLAERARTLVEQGRACGVRVVPTFSHADGSRGIVNARPEWKAHGEITHVTGTNVNKYNLCFSNPEVVDFYRATVADLVDLVEPDEIQFWLTENALWCSCDECAMGNDDTFELTRNTFFRQAKVYHDSILHARQTRPDLEVSIWTTQGSRYHNDPLIRSLPKDVLWLYYDGERRGTYNLRKRPVLTPEIVQLSRDGHRIAVQADWYSCGGFLTTPSRISEICEEVAQAGLLGVTAWISLHPFNEEKASGGAHPILAYAAEAHLNPLGEDRKSLSAVMRQAAIDVGHNEEVAAAAGQAWATIDKASRTIHLADCYAYWWQGVNLPGAICERIVRRAPVDEIDQRWIDETWDTTIPELDGAIKDIGILMDRLVAIEDASKYLQKIAAHARLIAEWGKTCRWLLWGSIVWHRLGGWDSTRGPWKNDHDELARSLQLASAALDSARDIWDDAHALIGPDTWRPYASRADTLKRQLDLARKAVNDGATPTPLPRDDTYPYQ